MKYYMAIVLLCASMNIFSMPQLSKKERVAQQEQIQQQKQQEMIAWSKIYLPYTHPELHKPYNLTLMTTLAVLCGQVMMIQPMTQQVVIFDNEKVVVPVKTQRIKNEAGYLNYLSNRFHNNNIKIKTAKNPSHR